jgi:radical SAM protein with 4Fe4S-binding SPASM domain
MALVDPPFAIQLEPVEGCSLACSFCGISSIRENGADAMLGTHGKNSAPYRFAELATIRRVIEEVMRLGWNPRIEFAMHGEPTMHPQLTIIVDEVRKLAPRLHLQLTTNGSGIMKDRAKIMQLMRYGIDLMVVDAYKHADFADRVRALLAEDCPYPVFEYPAQPEGNPHRRSKQKRIVFVHDISENETGNHQLTNQGGNSGGPLRAPLARRCAKPFRELSVRWDGNVALCCDDWKGEYKIGNVLETPLDELWHHARFDAARRRLYAKDRAFGPCAGCDVTTPRDGLLPDKMGKKDMPPPDAASEQHLRQALRGKVFTLKLAP